MITNTYSHSEALVMVGVTHISVVDKPDISDIEDFATLHFKEFFEVFRWFNEV